MWRDLITPEVGATPYVRGVIGIAHAMLGAAVVALFGAGAEAIVPLRIMITLGYWMTKERGDLRRGGSFWDGMEDSLFVWLGTFYGVAWWPVMMIGAGAGVMISGHVRKRERL